MRFINLNHIALHWKSAATPTFWVLHQRLAFRAEELWFRPTHKWSEAEWLWSGWSLVKVGWLLVRIEHLRAMHTEDPGSQDSSLLSFVRLVSDFVYAGRSNHLHTWTVGEMFRMNPLGLMHTEWFKKCQRCYQEKVTESAFSHVLERFEGNPSKKKKKTKPLHPEVEALRL